MAYLMPQEIEVWYVLPSVRKALAQTFIKDFKLKQKEAAKLLNLTESAVSQYLKSKRAVELKFSDSDQVKIKHAAKNIIDEPDKLMFHMYSLCKELRGTPNMCILHKKLDPSVHQTCNLCAHDPL